MLQKNGIEKYAPVGERFDPNLHNALFEVPDPSKDPGTIAVVTKACYSLFREFMYCNAVIDLVLYCRHGKYGQGLFLA